MPSAREGWLLPDKLPLRVRSRNSVQRLQTTCGRAEVHIALIPPLSFTMCLARKKSPTGRSRKHRPYYLCEVLRDVNASSRLTPIHDVEPQARCSWFRARDRHHQRGIVVLPQGRRRRWRHKPRHRRACPAFPIFPMTVLNQAWAMTASSCLAPGEVTFSSYSKDSVLHGFCLSSKQDRFERTMSRQGPRILL